MKMKKILYTVIVPLLLVGLLYIIFSYVRVSSKADGINTTGGTSEAGELFELQSFERIQGTEFLIANVVVKGTDSYYSREASGNEVRNIVFLDSKTLSSSQLFATNESVILRTSKYPNSQTGPAPPPYLDPPYVSPQDKNTVIQWLVYQIVKKDTNGDGDKDSKDLRTIAVSNVDGGDYIELLHGISGMNSMNMIEEGELIVVYSEGDVNKASILDLMNQMVVKTEEIIEIDEGAE
jgi:hypothetical protein